MKQIELFRAESGLQYKVNKFLEELYQKKYEVIDIQYSTCIAHSSLSEQSVMIVYNKPSE